MQRLIISLALLLTLTACAPRQSEGFSGRILLWHSLTNETEAAVLDDVLARFTDIYEDVTIVSQVVPRNDMLERYRTAAQSGLGPDLLIGESRWMPDLVEAGLIEDLTPLEPRVDIYFSGAVSSLRYTVNDENRIYGLPFALRPVALYFNTSLVEQPATTLDELLADAANGQRVAINTRFLESYWGTPAFGGQLFDADGRTVLDEGGFANWLGWLSNAQSEPGVFLSRDSEAILDLFMRERVAYMVARPDNLLTLKQTLGEEKVSVAPLPTGPIGAAGPLLQVDALMLNISSSQNQTELAMLLARFLTNSDQGGVFVRQSGIIPANRRVRIDEVAYPAEAGFRTQAQSAVSIPNLPQMTTVLEQADNLMIQVLEGVITEAEAARIITTTTNETHGYETEIVRNEDCTLEGELLLWHTLEGRPASTLGLIADNYMARCTDVSVELVFVDPEDEDPLDAFLGEVVAPPALLLGDANWTGRLVALSQVAPVTNATVQTYLPASIQQLISDGTVYGIPFSVSTLGLYYNPSQVETVATSLTELRTQAGEEALGLAMPIGFNDLYWGYTATDGQLVDASNVFVFDAQAWLQWLDWLDQTGNFETVRFSNDRNLLLDAFISGEVAYYIGTPQDFVDIETVMGTDSFAITTLPSGTGGEPTSALDVEAFFINNRVQETQVAIAQDFAIFATGSDQQQILLETTGLIPANVNIVLEDTAPVRPWFEQVQNAVPLPTSPEIETLRTDGTLIIDGVIRGSTTPQDGVTALGTLFDISITFDPTTNAPITTEEATEEVE